MITPEALTETLKAAFPEAHVEVFDKTGMSDHYILYIRSAQFDGMNTLARHRAVNTAVKPLMESGQLHAIEIKADSISAV
jgi:stress-induced morphogen